MLKFILTELTTSCTTLIFFFLYNIDLLFCCCWQHRCCRREHCRTNALLCTELCTVQSVLCTKVVCQSLSLWEIGWFGLNYKHHFAEVITYYLLYSGGRNVGQKKTSFNAIRVSNKAKAISAELLVLNFGQKQWYFWQIQFFFVANTVVFWANTVVF